MLSFEAIRNGFIKSLPELNMGNRNNNGRKEILPGFIVEFANWNYEITGCSNIIEGSFTDFKTISSLIDDIPDDLSFKEFNQYVNQFDNKYLGSLSNSVGGTKN